MLNNFKMEPKNFQIIEVMKFAWNKSQLYEAAVWNGFYLPDYNCSCVTIEYIENVVNGVFYSLKFSAMKTFALVKPPSKSKLFKYIKREAETAKIDSAFGFDMTNLPNTNFLVTVLYNLNSSHKIFNKGYVPKKKRKLDKMKMVFP